MEYTQLDTIKNLRTVKKTIKLAHLFEHDEDFPLLNIINEEAIIISQNYVNRILLINYFDTFIREIEYNLYTIPTHNGVQYLKQVSDYLYSNSKKASKTKFFDLFHRFVEVSEDGNSYSVIIDKIIDDVDKNLTGHLVEMRTVNILLIYDGVTNLYEELLNEVLILIEKEQSKETLKKNIKTDEDIVDLTEIESLEIKAINGKAILLDQLGILDFLRETYPELRIDSSTNLAKLLLPFFSDSNKDTKTIFKTTRRAFSDLYSDGINKTRTESALGKVNTRLLVFDIKGKSHC